MNALRGLSAIAEFLVCHYYEIFNELFIISPLNCLIYCSMLYLSSFVESVVFHGQLFVDRKAYKD